MTDSGHFYPMGPPAYPTRGIFSDLSITDLALSGNADPDEDAEHLYMPLQTKAHQGEVEIIRIDSSTEDKSGVLQADEQRLAEVRAALDELGAEAAA